MLQSFAMPLAKCPKCNRTFHVEIADPNSWYSRRWPHLGSAEFVPDLCWACRNARRQEWHDELTSDEQERKIC
jgi:hypothetical protein